MTAACRVNQLMAYFILRFTFRQALMQLSPDLCNTVAPVIGPVRGLARLVAVPRIAAPAANPEPRLRKIILLSAAPTDTAPEARPVFSDAGPAFDVLDELSIPTVTIANAFSQILAHGFLVVFVEGNCIH